VWRGGGSLEKQLPRVILFTRPQYAETDVGRKSEEVSGCAWHQLHSAQRVHTNEFVIGLKRTSEPRETFPPSNGTQIARTSSAECSVIL
jgi:hypothetical protein